jgi:segregation and condensation protein B
MEKGLIEEAGRMDLPGRPIAFRTTDTFLRTFGLTSLHELPPIHTGAGEDEPQRMQQPTQTQFELP